jgi:predicted acyl esterase
MQVASIDPGQRHLERSADDGAGVPELVAAGVPRTSDLDVRVPMRDGTHLMLDVWACSGVRTAGRHVPAVAIIIEWQSSTGARA